MDKTDVLITHTREQRLSFESALTSALERTCPEDVDPVIWRAHIDGLRSMIQTLRNEEMALVQGRVGQNTQNGKPA